MLFSRFIKNITSTLKRVLHFFFYQILQKQSNQNSSVLTVITNCQEERVDIIQFFLTKEQKYYIFDNLSKNIYMNKAIKLVYDPICPFAQRVWLALLEKEIPFEKLRVDLADKSQEFKDLYSKAFAGDRSNAGMVPILVYGDEIISESEILVWLLAQNHSTGTNLIPNDGIKRLKMRWFIKNITSKFVSAFYSSKGMSKSKTEEEQEKIKQKTVATVVELEKEIVGPYVLGEEFSMADVMVYPWLERFYVLKGAYGIQIPADCTKVLELKRLMEQRKSVQETLKEAPYEWKLNKYVPYFLG